MAVIVTINVGGFDYGFDFTDQEVEVAAGTDSVTADDLKDACRRAEWDFGGMVFPDIIETGNPITLLPGVDTALNVILLEQWRVLTLKTSGIFSLTGGNTVSQLNAADVFATNPNVTAVNNLSQAATRVNTTGSVAPSQQQIRDAMKLEHSDGDASVDLKLNNNFAISAAGL